MSRAPLSRPVELADFHAFTALPLEARQRIARVVKPRKYPAGSYLFRHDDRLTDSLFLLSGRVRLTQPHNPDAESREIRAGTPEALQALNLGIPPRFDALAVDASEVLVVPAQLLDPAFGLAHASSSYQVHDSSDVAAPETETETADPEQWMDRLLQIPLFRDIPPTSLFKLFQRLKPRAVSAGEIVIQQGVAADYFFVLSKGRAEVVRERPDGQSVPLAVKSVGESFGEEALLSGAPRNATVRMLTDGELRVLSATDFRELLMAPVVLSIPLTEALQRVGERQGLWLDVRLATDFARENVPGTSNVPYPLLRSRMARLDHTLPIVVFCADGRLSTTAVYLLREQGFDAWRLQGGVAALSDYVRAGGTLAPD